MPEPQYPTTPHVNQPGQVPRDGFEKDKAAPISRSHFLNGPAFSMFMPGQSRGVKEELPEVWPAAGSLLRVPKCVFLTSCPPAHLWGKNFTLVSKWSPFGYLGHWDDMHARDTRTEEATVGPYGTLIFGGFTGTYGYIGWTIDPKYPPENDARRKFNKCCVVRNAVYDEHYRLVAAFAEAKAYLEARYPNHVYVQICEFFPSAPVTKVAPNDELMPEVLDVYTPAGVEANTPKHGANGPLWVLGPDKTPDGFFGTNFLHIYCGYQADSGASVPPNVDDLLSRSHWARLKWGYSLDREFTVGFDQWLELEALPGGYESWAYDAFFHSLEGALGDSGGKLANLRAGWRDFAGYAVKLHEYDCVYDFPPAQFRKGDSARYPPNQLDYSDQDWVEQTVILAYGIRRDIYESSGDAYHDTYFPGPEGLLGDGAYNLFVRYPPGWYYDEFFNPRLNDQRDRLKNELDGLGPKTVAMWQALITDHGLDAMGFEYAGGSSAVTAASIIAEVIEHYGLEP